MTETVKNKIEAIGRNSVRNTFPGNGLPMCFLTDWIQIERDD